MPTVVSTGASQSTDAMPAARAAMTEALTALGGRQPSFVFAFAGPDLNLGRVLGTARDLAPQATAIGCTTAGELTERGLMHHGVAVLIVASDELTYDRAFAEEMTAQVDAAAISLCRGFEQARLLAHKTKRPYSTTILLTDGLCGTGERIIDQILDHTGLFQQLVGGAAGDEGRFKGTSVGCDDQVAEDAAAALHVFGPKPWGVGVGHGLAASSDRMRVTKATGNVVYEIEGRPAFDVYRQHAERRGVSLTPENTGSYLIGNELGIYMFGQIKKARAPLAVGENGSLRCAAAIPEGVSVCILDGEVSSMVAAARRAAEEARENLKGAQAAGVLLFDCVCRGMILGDRFSEEISAVREVFGEVPIGGFLTYGEIARYGGRLDGWHNTTAVVVAIPA